MASVKRLTSTTFRWNFTAPLTTLPTVTDGLIISGDNSGSLSASGGNYVDLAYDVGHSIGATWTCAPASFDGTFAGGGTLAPQTGLVT